MKRKRKKQRQKTEKRKKGRKMKMIKPQGENGKLCIIPLNEKAQPILLKSSTPPSSCPTRLKAEEKRGQRQGEKASNSKKETKAQAHKPPLELELNQKSSTHPPSHSPHLILAHSPSFPQRIISTIPSPPHKTSTSP